MLAYFIRTDLFRLFKAGFGIWHWSFFSAWRPSFGARGQLDLQQNHL